MTEDAAGVQHRRPRQRSRSHPRPRSRPRPRLRPLPAAPTLSQQATDLLRQRILVGDFKHGDRLVEAGIARELEISRGPVREALKLLRLEGLVREEPRRGTFVVSLNADDVREIYDLRAAIEARALRLLIRTSDSSASSELESILDRIAKAAEQGDSLIVAQYDFAFHEAICRLSGNTRLHQVFRSQSALLRTLIEADEARYYPALEDIWKEHRALLSAVQTGNVKEAEQLCDDHLERSKVHVIDYIQRMLNNSHAQGQ